MNAPVIGLDGLAGAPGAADVHPAVGGLQDAGVLGARILDLDLGAADALELVEQPQQQPIGQAVVGHGHVLDAQEGGLHVVDLLDHGAVLVVGGVSHIQVQAVHAQRQVLPALLQPGFLVVGGDAGDNDAAFLGVSQGDGLSDLLNDLVVGQHIHLAGHAGHQEAGHAGVHAKLNLPAEGRPVDGLVFGLKGGNHRGDDSVHGIQFFHIETPPKYSANRAVQFAYFRFFVLCHHYIVCWIFHKGAVFLYCFQMRQFHNSRMAIPNTGENYDTVFVEYQQICSIWVRSPPRKALRFCPGRCSSIHRFSRSGR